MLPRDPIAPVHKRRRRVQKKLDRRFGMLRCHGWSYERFARHTRALGEALARSLNARVALRG